MKVDKAQIMCLLLGITLYFAGTFVENQDTKLKEGNTLFRNTYGQGDKAQILWVDGLFDKPVPATLMLEERQYTKEEAERVFDPAYEVLLSYMLGENESLDHVQTNLNLVTWLEEYGMKVSWYSDRMELLDTSGQLSGEDCPKEGTDVFLTATLKAGEYSQDYIVKARIFPPDKTGEEQRMDGFLHLLRKLDAEQRNTDRLMLPENFEEASLSYEIKSDNDYWMFLLLGVTGAALIPLRNRQNKEGEKKKRERQMMLDYSEIVSKLVVLLGAGMPVRIAWEKVVADYEKKLQEGGLCRHAYEEMKNAYYLMGRGVAETKAYVEFGNRCRILPYRKLAGILEQNVKNGTAHLRPILETEMQDAFEQRKTLARRMGEEAGTKLLIPLFMMLAIVMVMISLPAFLSFGV